MVPDIDVTILSRGTMPDRIDGYSPSYEEVTWTVPAEGCTGLVPGRKRLGQQDTIDSN